MANLIFGVAGGKGVLPVARGGLVAGALANFLATDETQMKHGFFVAERLSEISPARGAGWWWQRKTS